MTILNYIPSQKNIQHRDRQDQTGGRLLIYAKENVNISRIILLENNLDENIWVQIHAIHAIHTAHRGPTTSTGND